MVATTRIFHNNRTQAVRFSKDVAFPDEVSEVEILVVGEARVVVPKGRRWDYFFAHGIGVSDDFMAQRDQSAPQERDSW